MPMPAQFQLGLELTNIVNPLSQAVSAVGSLAVIDAIKKAGSDAVTEIKLASLIGRHRIDEVMKWHFTERVARSDQSMLSRYLDIVLESGAGPTVQEALKNPALFSMVIQLSALAFSHEEESLANAIVEAIEKIVKESGKDLDMVPDYVSLLGTIKACREQTAAFSWGPIFEAVEWKLWRATRKVDEPEWTFPLGRRNLDFPVLQSLIMWINSLQSFPEHRMLHLRCRDGIITVVVWTHHILGLTITVAQGDIQTQFGKGPTNIFVECCSEASACLMEPSAPYEPLFNLVNDHQDPPMLQDPRCEAYGYGKRMLGTMQPKVADVLAYSNEIIDRCLIIAWGCRRLTVPEDVEGRSRTCPSDEDIIRTSQFIFAINSNGISVTEFINRLPRLKDDEFRETPTSQWLVHVIFCFSRIHCDDLEKCKDMPLAMNREVIVGVPRHWLFIEVWEKHYSTACFQTICALLLGQRYPLDYAMPAALVSAWGWSVFLGGIEANDPTDEALTIIRVAHGVPSRHGLRRPRIIDGPTSSLQDYSIRLDHPFSCLHTKPGIHTARMRLQLVGFHSDAFQALRVFDWNDEKGHRREARVGLREMQEKCETSEILPACPHDNINNFKAWLSNLRDNQTLKTHADPVDFASDEELPEAPPSHFPMNLTMLYGSLGTQAEDSTDMVFAAHTNEHVVPNDWTSFIACYYTTPTTAARWLQLCTICQGEPKTWGRIFIRSNDTCYRCALDPSRPHKRNHLGKSKRDLLLL